MYTSPIKKGKGGYTYGLFIEFFYSPKNANFRLETCAHKMRKAFTTLSYTL